MQRAGKWPGVDLANVSRPGYTQDFRELAWLEFRVQIKLDKT
jgi:hypothetical protein